MARVERFTSQEQIPVQQAQLIDPRGFPADTSSAEALKVAGETAFTIAKRIEDERKVKEELAKRKRDAQDRIGITDANAIMDNAEREYALRIVGKPLTEHEAIRLDELNKARAKVSQLDLSPDAREIVNSNTDIKAGRFAGIAELANIQSTDKDALIKTSEAYETALIEGDVSSIAEAEVLLDEQLKNMPPAEAAKFKDELEERATKEMVENAKKDLIERASVRPERVISFIDAELKSRTKGKKAIDEFELMTNEDLIEIRNYAESVGKNAVKAAKIEQKRKDDEIGDEFLDLLANKLDPLKPQLTFDMINDAEMSFEAKGQWFTKLMTFDNYSESELKEAFTDKGEVLAEIYDKIDDETLTDELDTMVGKGLSPTTAQRIKKERRAPYEARADKLFKNIFGWSPELGFENDLSSFLYLKTERDWREEIKKQDATGEQIIEIGRSIARPYFIEHLQKTMMGQEADISRMVELALGEEVPKTEPEILPKEDEGPRTQQDFLDEVSRLKAIDMTKAKAFYDAWIEKFRGTTEEK